MNEKASLEDNVHKIIPFLLYWKNIFMLKYLDRYPRYKKGPSRE